MDFLQLALVFLILLLGIMLSVLGLQVFLILKDLRKSLDKIDLLLGSAQRVASDIEKPAKVAAELTQVVEGGVKAGAQVVKKLTQGKPGPRLFKRR
ncbi:hypothetical protein A3A14_01855 [Candidatus Daviesbacteria bacterium RIFCSPLOWO2_01_FULL_43_38]|uniref:DUF948 domain-containing protein n=3 Tax=Candidatus Daviesiibacteriota TaxID=1752718 RepID=A0A1F5K509_9BACT|nr:MAG: hypothetical protein UV33_C0046G0002 [Candidatus Daviesbacteria bacterium GW2011_GWA1_42_6]KKS70426.1 MAG: hypothetical protein UV41_C0023G0005 [Candidatus Daviesbacteria bacterium GW2011_GWA2_42_7]OGE20182.1 MAG: hypothetical protein A2874_03365 [Candidatus Daviesbacteria bacterium RIFCSPHIGHO2_01_FULL_43_17]OGE36053.1 MAG: hypothetical protein A3E45_03920 [Candidatus Daviesbacteria bacterium RIFCSPHIGHO2_12_FULL_43_11]OGE63985.1 MAG: hypothetical protein A3A14_01855 [Candidatus Davies